MDHRLNWRKIEDRRETKTVKDRTKTRGTKYDSHQRYADQEMTCWLTKCGNLQQSAIGAFSTICHEACAEQGRLLQTRLDSYLPTQLTSRNARLSASINFFKFQRLSYHQHLGFGTIYQGCDASRVSSKAPSTNEI